MAPKFQVDMTQIYVKEKTIFIYALENLVDNKLITVAHVLA